MLNSLNDFYKPLLQNRYLSFCWTFGGKIVQILSFYNYLIMSTLKNNAFFCLEIKSNWDANRLCFE